MIAKENFSETEVRDQLARILASKTFGSRSAVHHLLSYLVEKSLNEPNEPLKEYTVGVQAFARPASYDPQQDAYVRVQAGKLRQKLQDYYSTEGASDPIQIELPKRQFLLEFHQREQSEAPADAEPVISLQTRRTRREWMAWCLAGALALWAVAATLRQPMQPEHRTDPALAAIWRPFLSSDRPVLISLGTHQFYSYIGGSLREPALDLATEDQVQARLDQIRRALRVEGLRPSQGYTGTGQATGAFLLGRFFGQAGAPIELVRSSSLSWDDISVNNVIFIGSAKSNPQIRSIPADWAFQIEGENIVNRIPKSGEQPFYTHSAWSRTGEREEYSLISFVPGLHKVGEMLVIEAATTTGIWAGAKYLTDPRYAAELKSKLAGNGEVLPRHYQAVLRLQVRDAVPLTIGYVAHRVL